MFSFESFIIVVFFISRVGEVTIVTMLLPYFTIVVEEVVISYLSLSSSRLLLKNILIFSIGLFVSRASDLITPLVEIFLVELVRGNIFNISLAPLLRLVLLFF